ncbi:MAG: DUF302 domain-containing protein [Cocleimonas sp.]
MSYTINASIKQSIEPAIEILKEVCMNHKLGIVSDIDVQATIKNKLGEEISPYRILGACNPGLAKRLIEAEPKSGALLPCTVVAREEDGTTHFHFMAPEAVLGLEDNAIVKAIAKEAAEHINAVANELNAK